MTLLRSALVARGSHTAGIDCSNAAEGRFRSRSVVQWKLGPDGTVRTGNVTSAPVRKSRLGG